MRNQAAEEMQAAAAACLLAGPPAQLRGCDQSSALTVFILQWLQAQARRACVQRSPCAPPLRGCAVTRRASCTAAWLRPEQCIDCFILQWLQAQARRACLQRRCRPPCAGWKMRLMLRQPLPWSRRTLQSWQSSLLRCASSLQRAGPHMLCSAPCHAADLAKALLRSKLTPVKQSMRVAGHPVAPQLAMPCSNATGCGEVALMQQFRW